MVLPKVGGASSGFTGIRINWICSHPMGEMINLWAISGRESGMEGRLKAFSPYAVVLIKSGLRNSFSQLPSDCETTRVRSEEPHLDLEQSLLSVLVLRPTKITAVKK